VGKEEEAKGRLLRTTRTPPPMLSPGAYMGSTAGARPAAFARPAPNPIVLRAPSPRPRAGLSVEDWEARAPLPEAVLGSVAAVQAAAAILPLPLKVRSHVQRRMYALIGLQFSARDDGSDGASSAPGTPASRARGLLSSRPGTPALRGKPAPLAPTQPLGSAQAFLDWAARVDGAAAHAQEAAFRVRLADVGARRAACTRLAASVDAVQAETAAMTAEWRGVEASGESLKGACERLLAERVRARDLCGWAGR
jgi:hypothetical protein